METPDYTDIIHAWRLHWDIKAFKKLFICSFIFFVFSMFFYTNFIQWCELRESTVLNDPILKLFKPIDLTWICFFFVYLGVICGTYLMLQRPLIICLGLIAYSLMALLRSVTIFLMPLSPPTNILPLVDPFAQIFLGGKLIQKDLFFSGHTATMFFFYLCNMNGKIRYLFFIATIIIGTCVLAQHVHYTIDVIAAPFFMFMAYFWASKIVKHFIT
ncbi:MAG: phosphatase PAP2-related protein [Bacteriovoracaceae bacterium]